MRTLSNTCEKPSEADVIVKLRASATRALLGVFIHRSRSVAFLCHRPWADRTGELPVETQSR